MRGKKAEHLFSLLSVEPRTSSGNVKQNVGDFLGRPLCTRQTSLLWQHGLKEQENHGSSQSNCHLFDGVVVAMPRAEQMVCATCPFITLMFPGSTSGFGVHSAKTQPEDCSSSLGWLHVYSVGVILLSCGACVYAGCSTTRSNCNAYTDTLWCTDISMQHGQKLFWALESQSWLTQRA